MAENTARVPRTLIEAVEEAASQLNRSDARILLQALEDYLEECEVRERLRDPSDPVLAWDEVRRELLDAD